MEEKELLWNIFKVKREHHKTIEKKISCLGIHPSQHHLLMYLARNGSSSQNSIAAAMGVSPATIAVSLKKLEKGKYIEKKVNSEDNRFNQIVLTERGKQVVLQSEQIFSETDKALFRGFSSEEKEQLYLFLERMLGNIKNEEEI